MFLSDYAYNRGLLFTTVASSTVLVSSSCVFVYFLSVLLQIESFKWLSLVGVLLTVFGTTLTTLHDAQDQDEPGENDYDQVLVVKGDMFSLIAAVGYAVYSVQARILCPEDEELFSMPLLLGYVGVICAVPLLPMAVFQFVQIEISWHLVMVLIVKGLLDFVVTDYLLFRAVMLTNATIANVGLGLSIPLAFVADALVQATQFSALQLTGAGIVLLGFVLVNGTDDEKNLGTTNSPIDAIANFKVDTDTNINVTNTCSAERTLD